MSRCRGGCEDNDSILCNHRFDFNARVIYCNGKGYSGWPDSKILTHFLNYIRGGIDRGLLLRETIFVIVTKDVDFLKDAETELKGDREKKDEWTFGANFGQCGDIVIFTQLVDSRNYGRTGRDNIECAINKLNRFFLEMSGTR